MNERDLLVERFEAQRGRLRAVAYRMLGSASEAEDAVQEAWIRMTSADADAVDNMTGWLTTVTARICLDMLRARKSRRADAVDPNRSDRAAVIDLEQEAMLADSVGLALMV